jgi:hypothetical protein
MGMAARETGGTDVTGRVDIADHPLPHQAAVRRLNDLADELMAENPTIIHVPGD